MSEFTAIILDADSLIYRCGFAAEGEPVSHALYNLKHSIKDIREALHCETIYPYIKGKDNFREKICVSTVYKGTRSGLLPEHYDALKEYLLKYYPTKECHGMEADDYCSALLWKHRAIDSGIVLAAMDKDLWNTPGWHYNYHPKKKVLEYVTTRTADCNFITQLLTGDRSDNIPGLPSLPAPEMELYGITTKGVGPAAAQRIFEFAMGSLRWYLINVFKCYLAYGRDNEIPVEDLKKYFIEQGQLLWMARDLIDDTTPVLWTPPAFLNVDATVDYDEVL